MTARRPPFNPAGQVTIVNYWATCVRRRAGWRCRYSTSSYRKHHRQGGATLAISIDQGTSTRKLEAVTTRFAFPVARVDDVKVPRRGIPNAIPVTRVYDRSGRLVFQTRGDGRIGG